MNILIVSAVFPPEPVVSSKLSEDLALELSKEHMVTVICPKPTRPYGFVFTNNEKVIGSYQRIVLDSYTCPKSTIFGRIKESYSFGKASYKYIKNNEKKIDCIYMNTWPIFGQYFVKKAAIKSKIPYVIHIQDVYPESLANKVPFFGRFISLIFRPFDAKILRKANQVIAISEKMKNYLHQTRSVPFSKISVVLNWQNEAHFMDLDINNSDEANVFTFMYLGNVGPIAGCDLLISAFSDSNLDKSRLVIAGSGSMRESLKLQVKDLGINNVEFWDVPDGEVPKIQAKAVVMLLPIKKGAASSSIPSKLPAYMFSAKPIIAAVDSDSDTANAIREAGCGWVIEPEKPEILAKLIKEVQELPKSELITMGLKGREYALKHFSKMNNLSKLVGVIEKILKQ